MAMISKEIFDRFVSNDLSCSLLHPHTESCWKASIYFLKHGTIGMNKFFLPIYLLQMILYGKKVNKEFLKKRIKAYKITIIYGVLYVMLFIGTNCCMRQLLGRFHYPIIGFFSGFVAGLPIFIESPENRLMNTLIFSSLGVEAMIRNLEWYKIIQRTPIKETFVFMMASGILMHLLETQNINVTNFWFFHPSRIIKRKSETSSESKDLCYHGKLDCLNFILKESLKYFGFGYALEMVKFSIANLDKIILRPGLFLKMVKSKKNVLFGATIGGYVAIYRLVSCLLFKYDKKVGDYHSLIAGTLSGLTYLIKPNLQFLSLAIVTIIQLLIQKLRRYVPLSNHLIGILFAFLNGILLHHRFFHVKTCPNYTKNMVTVCTNGVADHIYANILTKFPPEVLF